jgi:hypothetical protein
MTAVRIKKSIWSACAAGAAGTGAPVCGELTKTAKTA